MAVTQPLQLERSLGEVSLPITPFPLYINDRVFTTAEDETVPAGASRVLITPSADAWFAFGTGTSQLPAVDVADGTGSVFIAKGVCRGFFVTPGSKISMTSDSGTAKASFEYFATDAG